ncbi:nitrile hydratase subunit beta [Sulfitobacter sp. BDSS02]|nr:nitrile hydratase subunit beta [Sulfitobacter sp. BDSS02]MBR9848293.1 nitrile hydratase subunit beta [Paracoccaceae bacterium]
MSRVHDMGGRFGDGPVIPEPEDAPVFHKDWHARALAVTLAAGALGKWNIDTSRHARECVGNTDYARFSYYEKWIAALTDLLVATELVSRDDLRASDPDQQPLSDKAMTAVKVAAVLSKGGPADRDSDILARFVAGDTVLTRRPADNRLVDGGHTRLPAYAAGARGRVLMLHGSHVLPDSNAHGLGEAPEPLYAVVFPAAELWAAPEHPDDEVVLDLWQSYLEPA